MSKVSVIIPVYILNQELLDLTLAAFESLRQTDWDNEQIELILVDDGSPEYYNVLKTHSDIYIRGHINHGFPWAVNKGIQVSSGEFLVIANNDIKVSPNWLKVAKEIFTQDEKVGSVHYRMLEYEQPVELGNDVWVSGKERWCHGSFFVIRREALPEELYCEMYGKGGYDDYDLFHRMRDINGWKQTYTNKAAFQHKHSSTQIALDKVDGTRAKRDFLNREIYKGRFGEYPEIQFAKTFPEQMNLSWRPFP